LGNFLVAQREESRLGQLQALQLFAARGTVIDVGFHLNSLRGRQFAEEVFL
jgi:hypothetical protein